MKVNYGWLQTFFDKPLPATQKVADTLTFGAFEIEGIVEHAEGDSTHKLGAGDAVIDVKVLPNRAHDCLCHRGIAKELSVLLDIPMARDPLREPKPVFDQDDTSLSIEVADPVACPVYIAALVKGVAVGESPEWLQARLAALGQRSINNVVDATNYVMLELGQPLHAFDAQKLFLKTGAVKIGVRPAKAGEKITALGGQEYELAAGMSLIVDANLDEPIAIAGIKGGTKAEVDNHTTDIVIESAKFAPVLTRKSSQSLRLRTDASYRYENEIPDELPFYGMEAVVKLIKEIAGGAVAGYGFADATKTQEHTINISTEKTNKVLGTELTDDAVEGIIKRFGFAYTPGFTVVAPFERLDMRIAEDMVEEIGRVYGYHNIAATPLPAMKKAPTPNLRYVAAELVRAVLQGLGFTEVLTYSLRDDGELALSNSLAADKHSLRKNLMSGVVEALAKGEYNAPLLGIDVVKVFEIGNVFTKDGEYLKVAVGVRPTVAKKRAERAKEMLVEAQNALEVALGKIEPVYAAETFEFDLGRVAETATIENPMLELIQDGTRYAPLSAYPFVLRDIALWVPAGTAAEAVHEIIKQNGGELLIKLDKFDEFSKEGRTSYAFHLVFQSHEKTLSDVEVNEVMSKVSAALTGKGFEIR